MRNSQIKHLISAPYRVTRRAYLRIARRITVPFLGTITGIETREKLAALTFDDGPDPVTTPLLLEILKNRGAKATFFMLGRSAVKYPEIVREAAEAGHAIGVHSWDHPSFRLIDSRERRRQIIECEKALSPYAMKFFRPPYGDMDLASRIDCMRMDYKVVNWSYHVSDWEEHDALWITKALSEKLAPGCIILMHDSISRPHRSEDRLHIFHALDEFLGAAQDFQFITVPELLDKGPPKMDIWYNLYGR